MNHLKSSTGSGKVSRTVKGILTSLIPVIVITGQYFDIGFTADGLSEGIAIIAGIIGAVVALNGYIRAKRYI